MHEITKRAGIQKNTKILILFIAVQIKKLSDNSINFIKTSVD